MPRQHRDYFYRQASFLLDSVERALKKDGSVIYVNLFNSGFVFDVKDVLLKTIRTTRVAINIKKKKRG